MIVKVIAGLATAGSGSYPSGFGVKADRERRPVFRELTSCGHQPSSTERPVLAESGMAGFGTPQTEADIEVRAIAGCLRTPKPRKMVFARYSVRLPATGDALRRDYGLKAVELAYCPKESSHLAR